MDLQFGRRRRVLPADLRQRVQRHQPGRRHVQVGVRQGQARRRRPCSPPTRPTAPSPLTVNFSSAGSLDEDPGDSIRFEWNFGDGSPISTEPNPTHTYTQRGRFTAVLTVFDSSGEKTIDEHDHHRRATRAPTVTVDGAAGRRPVLLRRRAGVQGHRSPTRRTRRSTATTSRSRSCSATTRTATPMQSRNGCRGFLPTDADDVVARRQRVRRRSAPTYTDKGAAGGVPSLTTTSQIQVRQKRQEVEHVVTQSGTNTATNTDGGARRRTAAASARATGSSSTVRSTCSRSTRSRSAWHATPRQRRRRTVGSPLARDRGPSGLADRPDRGDVRTSTSTGSTRRVDTARRSRSPLGGQARAVPRVPLGHRRRRRAATCSTSTGSSSAATASRSRRPTRRAAVGGTRAGDAVALARHARRRSAPFTPGVARTYDAEHDGQRDLDRRVTRR